MRVDPGTERAILGAMVMDAEARVLGLEALNVEDFVGKNRQTFELLSAAHASRIPTGIAPFVDFAMRGDKSERHVLVFERAAHLAGEACSTGMLRQHMRSLRMATAGRLASRLVTEAKDKIDRGEVGPEVFESMTEKVRALGTLDDELVPLCPDLQPRTGLVGTGIPTVDRLLGGGVAQGEVMVVGARTSVGKSALALQMAIDAMQHGGVVYWSMEMSREALGRRALSQMAAVDSMRLARGEYDLEEKARIEDAWDRLRDGKIQYFWRGDLGSLRRAVIYQSPVLIVVDYIQLIEAPASQRGENRAREIGAIMHSLVALAKQRNTPIVIVAQLNRGPDLARRAPRLSDLRESGDIEQDADVVLLLDRNPSAEKPSERADTFAFIAKNREGSTGMVKLHFMETITKFVATGGPEPEDYDGER